MDVEPVANGESDVLLFDLDVGTGTGPLGVTRGLTVMRDVGGSISCGIDPKASNGIRPLKGGAGTGGPDVCHQTKSTETYAMESAACDDGACIVTVDDASKQHLRIAATAAQIAAGARVEARLRVTLKSTKDGALYHDSYVVRFARAARIDVQNGIASPLPLMMPMMPGVELVMPGATVVDDAGEELDIEAASLVSSVTGESILPTSSGSYGTSYVAKAPGHAKLTWELPGVIARSLDLEVVDPSKVRSLVVLASEDERKRRSVAQTLDEALAIAEAPAVETLAATAHRHIVGELRVVLEDGRTALVNVDRVETDRPAEAQSRVEEGAFRIYRLGPAAVTGTVTVHAAGLSRSLPFTLTP